MLLSRQGGASGQEMQTRVLGRRNAGDFSLIPGMGSTLTQLWYPETWTWTALVAFGSGQFGTRWERMHSENASRSWGALGGSSLWPR